MTTAATIGTSVEATLHNIQNEDMVRGLQNVAFDLKFGLAVTANTAQDGTGHTINLWDEFGIKRLLGVKGFAHSTEDSVIITEDPTTRVNNGVLEVTTVGSNGAVKRVYLVIGV